MKTPSGMVMIIIACATMFGPFLAVTRIPFELAAWLSSWIIMGFIILFFLITGCFVDALALIMLTIPILVTLVIAALILMLFPAISLWLPNLGG